MQTADVIQIIGAIGILVTTIATAMVTVRNSARVRDVQTETVATHADVTEAKGLAVTTHEIVNSQRTEMVAQIGQLADVLRAAGLPVPPPRQVPDGHPDTSPPPAPPPPPIRTTSPRYLPPVSGLPRHTREEGP